MTSEVLWLIIIILIILLIVSKPMQANLHIPNIIRSSELSLEGDCGHNIIVALNANNQALQKVILKPNEVFSFNATIGDPELLDYRLCDGIPGGNWCNLASLYSQAARSIDLYPKYIDHGIDLGAGRENSVTIWNIDGLPGTYDGRFDLIIENDLSRTVTFLVIQEGDNIHIEVV